MYQYLAMLLTLRYVIYSMCDSYCLVTCIPQDGWTALIWASLKGHADVVQDLITGGAQVNLQNEVKHVN